MEKSKYKVEYSYTYINSITDVKEEEVNKFLIIESEISCEINTFKNGFKIYANNNNVSVLIKAIGEYLYDKISNNAIIKNIKNA
jgi:hypothetical protein